MKRTALAEDPPVQLTRLPGCPTSIGGFAVRFTHPTALKAGLQLAEKLPLLGLAAVAIGMTIWAQSSAIAFSRQYTLSWRLRYVPIAYLIYLGKFFCPVDLAAHIRVPALKWRFGKRAARWPFCWASPRRRSRAAAVPLPAGRLAVVPRNGGAHGRIRAARRGGGRRSQHVFAANRAGDCRRLGCD